MNDSACGFCRAAPFYDVLSAWPLGAGEEPHAAFAMALPDGLSPRTVEASLEG